MLSLRLQVDKYLDYYCRSFILSFLTAACFLRAMNYLNTQSLTNLPVSHILSVSFINPLHLTLLVSVPLFFFFLSVYITALALLCISSACFEAISMHDHYQTSPKERWARQKDRGRNWKAKGFSGKNE